MSPGPGDVGLPLGCDTLRPGLPKHCVNTLARVTLSQEHWVLSCSHQAVMCLSVSWLFMVLHPGNPLPLPLVYEPFLSIPTPRDIPISSLSSNHHLLAKFALSLFPVVIQLSAGQLLGVFSCCPVLLCVLLLPLYILNGKNHIFSTVILPVSGASEEAYTPCMNIAAMCSGRVGLHTEGHVRMFCEHGITLHPHSCLPSG